MKKAAQLSNEHVASRSFEQPSINLNWRQRCLGEKSCSPDSRNCPREPQRNRKGRGESRDEVQEPGVQELVNEARALEARRRTNCYICKELGHLVRNCPKNRHMSACMSSHANSQEMLKPYTNRLIVNAHKCKGLRDTVATMDVVDEKYIKREGYLTGCIWVRQPISKGSVCLQRRLQPKAHLGSWRQLQPYRRGC